MDFIKFNSDNGHAFLFTMRKHPSPDRPASEEPSFCNDPDGIKDWKSVAGKFKNASKEVKEVLEKIAYIRRES